MHISQVLFLVKRHWKTSDSIYTYKQNESETVWDMKTMRVLLVHIAHVKYWEASDAFMKDCCTVTDDAEPTWWVFCDNLEQNMYSNYTSRLVVTTRSTFAQVTKVRQWHWVTSKTNIVAIMVNSSDQPRLNCRYICMSNIHVHV